MNVKKHLNMMRTIEQVLKTQRDEEQSGSVSGSKASVENSKHGKLKNKNSTEMLKIVQQNRSNQKT